MPKNDLERGWRKAHLILQLAQGEKNQDELAAEHGVTQPAISLFATRHAEEVQLQRENITDQWVGLWVADKRKRVAEIQSDVERIDEAVNPDDKFLRIKHAALKQVAEELGQLKQEIEVTGTLTYVVEGIDIGKLR